MWQGWPGPDDRLIPSWTGAPPAGNRPTAPTTTPDSGASRCQATTQQDKAMLRHAPIPDGRASGPGSIRSEGTSRRPGRTGGTILAGFGVILILAGVVCLADLAIADQTTTRPMKASWMTAPSWSALVRLEWPRTLAGSWAAGLDRSLQRQDRDDRTAQSPAATTPLPPAERFSWLSHRPISDAPPREVDLRWDVMEMAGARYEQPPRCPCPIYPLVRRTGQPR